MEELSNKNVEAQSNKNTGAPSKRSKPKDKAMKLKVGRIGKKALYLSKKGYFAPARASTGKAMPQRMHEHMDEFSHAARSGKLLRVAFRPLLKQVREASRTNMHSRLMGQLLKVIQSDTVHRSGERTVVSGNVSLLKGFDFNLSADFDYTFSVPCLPSINRGTGELKVEVPAFVPDNAMGMPAGATHFKIVAAGAAMDFVGRPDGSEVAASAVMEVDQDKVEAMVLQCILPAGSTKVLLLVLGVLFFQKVQGQLQPVREGKSNCLRIVAVNS